MFAPSARASRRDALADLPGPGKHLSRRAEARLDASLALVAAALLETLGEQDGLKQHIMVISFDGEESPGESTMRGSRGWMRGSAPRRRPSPFRRRRPGSAGDLLFVAHRRPRVDPPMLQVGVDRDRPNGGPTPG